MLYLNIGCRLFPSLLCLIVNIVGKGKVAKDVLALPGGQLLLLVDDGNTVSVSQQKNFYIQLYFSLQGTRSTQVCLSFQYWLIIAGSTTANTHNMRFLYYCNKILQNLMVIINFIANIQNCILSWC